MVQSPTWVSLANRTWGTELTTNLGLVWQEALEPSNLSNMFWPALLVTLGISGCVVWCYHRAWSRKKRRMLERVFGADAKAKSWHELEQEVGKVFSQRAENERATHILTSITEGLLVLDPNGCIVDANQSIASMLGYGREELVGKPFEDIYVKLESTPVHGFFKEARAFREEELFKTKAGKVIPVRFSSSFLLDAEMEVQGFVCIAKDITLEKQFEAEISRQNKWFRVTLASIGDAVITTSNQGAITYMNHAAETLTGWLLKDAIDRPVDEVFRLITKNDRTRVSNQPKAMTDAEPAFECLLQRKDEEEITVDRTVTPLQIGRASCRERVYAPV